MWKALILLLFLQIVPAGAQEPRIEGLHVTRQNGRILVSFELRDALDAEMLERVQSGLPTEVTFTLRLERPRVWWFDKVFDRTTLQVVAMYNAVTREYLVNYKLDGRLIESRMVTDLPALERALTLYHSLPAFELAEEIPPPRLQLTVRAALGSKPFLFLFPNRVDTGWARFWLNQPSAPGE
ncbi:MAG TPA: DUF4390 domain-containing protein [Thermoanaerobaculia bacterium]|nr:DUF4390 domain-containing protein [Thermoanaerobaculia bacterium]